MKAKPIERTRQLKSWRIDPEILLKLSEYSKKKKMAESEILEKAIKAFLPR